MRVYHFLNEEYGLNDLSERRLKISQIMKLNDPFEFLSIALSDKALRKRLLETKDRLNRQVGLICFSASWKNPVQWSHYANHHKGVCLGFDVLAERVNHVKYVEDRVQYVGDGGDLIVRELLTCKYSHWNYEQEVRIFVDLGDAEEGLYYKNFGDDLILREVIVGANSKIRRADIITALGKDSGLVKAFKARAAFQKFEITENLNSKAWA